MAELDAGPYWGNSNLPPRFNEPHVIMVEERAWDQVHRERDKLRAEVADLLPRLDADAVTIETLARERNEARAEVERLTAERNRIASANGKEIGRRIALGQEVQRLQAVKQAYRELLDSNDKEIERLRAVIESLRAQMPHWVANVLDRPKCR